VEDHAREILGHLAGEPTPVAVITDHDAEDRATLERHLGFGAVPAIKSSSDGIQAYASRTRMAGDGRARIFLMRDTLVARDPDLVERKLPNCTEEEIESYIWDEKKDLLVKRDDHGNDAMRYCVMFADFGSEGEACEPLGPDQILLAPKYIEIFESCADKNHLQSTL
jgi:hypothetical protein